MTTFRDHEKPLSTQGGHAPRSYDLLHERGAFPQPQIDQEPPTDPSFLRKHWKKIGAGVLAGSTLVGAIAMGPKIVGANDSSPERTQPGTSAPAVPGAGETTTASREVTADTAEFRVGNETIVGVDEFYQRIALFRTNDPKAPAPSMEEGLKIFDGYLKAVQTVVNTETTKEGQHYLDEVTAKALFDPGSSGAFQTFIANLQAQGGKITGLEEMGLLWKPDKVTPAHGEVTITTQMPNGDILKYRVSVATTNNEGLIRAQDYVSEVKSLASR